MPLHGNGSESRKQQIEAARVICGLAVARRADAGVSGLFWASAWPSSASDPVRSIELPRRERQRFRDESASYICSTLGRNSSALPSAGRLRRYASNDLGG